MPVVKLAPNGDRTGALDDASGPRFVVNPCELALGEGRAPPFGFRPPPDEDVPAGELAESGPDAPGVRFVSAATGTARLPINVVPHQPENVDS